MKILNLIIVLFLLYKFGGASSSSGGDLHNITYPYYIPGICGQKGFELQRDGNDTVVYIDDVKYHVKDLSVTGKTLMLVDPNYFALGDCSIPGSRNLTWFQSLIDTAAYQAPETLVSFYAVYFFDCSEELEDTKSYKLINCTIRPRSRVYASRNYAYVSEIPRSCRYAGLAPTSNDYLDMNWEGIDTAQLMQILRQGFVISWDTTYTQICVPPLQFCWRLATSNLHQTMTKNHSTIWDKLHSFLSLEYDILACTQQPRDYVFEEGASEFVKSNYNSSTADFCLMLILVALLDIILILIALRLILLPPAIFSFLVHKYTRASLSINSVEKFLRKHELFSVKRYDFIEIALMTNQFKEKLGQGGFGSVYKGKLFNGRQVAVKVLTNSLGDGDDFISEVATIGRIHHSNIVRLIGFCSEGSNRALVYPYMPNGSLDKYIFSANSNSLSVEKRRLIALGIARGIDYLHRGCEMQILHFDIKPHNILLDYDFTPKISDFGLAKLYTREYNLVTLSAARGTIGYIAPELVSRAFGVVSYKADVYSFGMLLMEMTSGRRNVNNCVESSNQVYYPSWVYDQLKLKEEMCNSNYLNNVSFAQFGEIEGIMYKVALWCIQMTASNRPSMSRVIEMLQSDAADSLEMPLRPFTTSSQHEFPMRCSQLMDSCSIELSSISEEISML